MDSDRPTCPSFFARQNEDLHLCAEIDPGQVCLFTTRCPGKESDNEDAAAIIPVDGARAILAVADGVGGQPGGAGAAELTLQCLAEAASVVCASNNTSLQTAIMEAIEKANELILDKGIGSATTLAALEIEGDSVRPYHVGDSMIIIVGQRGKMLHQTVPHSPVGYAVEAGLLDEQEAIHHVDRHVVSNVVGSPDMRIEVGSAVKLKRHDTVLLASDGIFDNLHVAEIVDLIRKGSLLRSAMALATGAQRRMLKAEPGHPSKPDDTTFLLFRRLDEDAEKMNDMIGASLKKTLP